MGLDGVSRVDVVELPGRVRQRVSMPGARFSDQEGLPSEMKATAKTSPMLHLLNSDPEAAELLIGSKTRVSSNAGPTQNYAKIRFDENSSTVLIQIISASSGEVLREIPPGAWRRSNEGIQWPKGTLVEREQ